ncbi:dihydropteroate synthase, partial [Escherichia coli]|uniref:dihydropteroate synthase n=1 Tax=Escherichia coli TaxID=562 RepID=UPI00200CE437
LEDGAAIIDIGGESTRPGHRPVEANVEKARIVPVIEALYSLPVPLSVDTMKAEVAAAALGAGARIVNDVWGLQRDIAMAPTIADHGAAVILM